MIRKPSDRTNRHKPLEGLNLTPFVDIIMSIMFFLLIFAALIPIVIIDAPLPKVASTADEIRKAKELKETWNVTVWIIPSGFVVKAGGYTGKIAKKKKDEYPYEDLHNFLVKLHQRNPRGKEITLVPSDDSLYHVMIATMDAARNLIKGDPGFKPVPPEIAQKPESLNFNKLFPDVIIGGV